MKTMSSLAGIALVLLGALVGMRAAEAMPLRSQLNFKCMDVPGENYSAGTELHMWDCHGKENQQFQFSGNGEIRIRNLCVDAFGGLGNAGDKIGLWNCNGGANQRWRLEGNQIKGMNGRCIDIVGGSTSNGAKLVLWDCHGGDNQYWVTTGIGSSQRLAWERRYLNPRGLPERCFGAVGSGCDGAPKASTTKYADGRVEAKVAVGSILHDNCCVKNPDGMMCGGSSNNIVAPDQLAGMSDYQACAKEWRKAVYNTTNGRTWSHFFGPYQDRDLSPTVGDDLTPTTGRTTKMADRSGNFVYAYDGGESLKTEELCAPTGTDLDKEDEQFCCSKRFKETGYMLPAMVGAWGKCQ